MKAYRAIVSKYKTVECVTSCSNLRHFDQRLFPFFFPPPVKSNFVKINHLVPTYSLLPRPKKLLFKKKRSLLWKYSIITLLVLYGTHCVRAFRYTSLIYSKWALHCGAVKCTSLQPPVSFVCKANEKLLCNSITWTDLSFSSVDILFFLFSKPFGSFSPLQSNTATTTISRWPFQLHAM